MKFSMPGGKHGSLWHLTGPYILPKGLEDTIGNEMVSTIASGAENGIFLRELGQYSGLLMPWSLASGDGIDYIVQMGTCIQEDGFKQPVPSQHREMIPNANMFYYWRKQFDNLRFKANFVLSTVIRGDGLTSQWNSEWKDILLWLWQVQSAWNWQW